jgi:hypothetical protein
MLEQPYCFLTVEGKHAKGKGFEIAEDQSLCLMKISSRILEP